MNRAFVQRRMIPASRILHCNTFLGLRPRRAVALQSSVVVRSFSSTILRKHQETETQKLDLSSVDHIALSELHPGPHVPIRERFRIWEENHVEDVLKGSNPFDTDVAAPGALDNSVTRPSEGGRLQEDNEDDVIQTFGGNDLVDLGDRRPFLLRGDMVDLVFHGGQKSELAVFVQDFETTSQFYTMSGQWVHRKPRSVMYYVPGFIHPSELNPLLPYLPQEDVGDSAKDKLHSFEKALPRSIGAAIVREMRDFWAEADTIYRLAAHRLDKAHKLLAHPNLITNATINELANTILPDSVKRDEQGNLPPSAVYAVYRVLAGNDRAFRPSNAGTQRTTGLFEISPQSELHNNATVTQWAHEHEDSLMDGDNLATTKKGATIRKFLKKARAVIDQNRKIREPTKYGVVGPRVSSENNLEANQHQDRFWDKDDIQILMFFESWAALRSFKTSSTLNSVGSHLLRLLDRYPDYNLDMGTAWQFLQEVGLVAPWETRTAFDARLPQTGIRLQEAPEFPGSSGDELEVKDVMAEHRHDWGNTSVYCIDDIGAHEIDDGVSIEAVEGTQDQHWVHIHTADPAAVIEPGSDVDARAKDIVGNIYMPERVRSMLAPSIVMKHMSLAPHRRILTFSARMGNEGEILESKITSGVAQNVKFVSPDTVKEVIGRVPEVSPLKTVIQVGPKLDSSFEPRPMVKASDLTEADIQNLKLLDKYGQARAKVHASKGDLSLQFGQAKIGVQFPQSSPEEIVPLESTVAPIRLFNHDPSITLECDRFDSKASDSSANTVRNLMVIASEVAGNWCRERNIPIIYRATPQHPDRPDPSDFYHQFIKPAQDKDGNIPFLLRFKYLRFLGGAKGTTTPAPHLQLGMDFYTRVTSPLRRYSDLLAHWQIQAAIREESRTGISLVGSTREDYLPFTKAQLEALLPHLDAKESQISMLHKDNERQWAINLLIRAWQFKEAKLPDTFDVFVMQVNEVHGTNVVSGFMVDLGLQVQFNLPEWTERKHIQLGDVFECEIEDLQSYDRKISMKALSKKKTVGEDGWNP